MAVHLRHITDGWPLCWPQDREDTFDGSYKEEEVTCTDCIAYMEQDHDADVNLSIM